MSKKSEDKSLPNLKVLQTIRVRGDVCFKGAVVSKKHFDNKADWQNLCHMEPPRLEETDEKLFTPKRDKATKADKATKGDTLPGA